MPTLLYPRQHIVWHSGGASKEIAHVLSRIAVRKVKQQDEQRLGMRSNVWRVAPNPINAHHLSGSRKEHSTMTAGASPMVLSRQECWHGVWSPENVKRIVRTGPVTTSPLFHSVSISLPGKFAYSGFSLSLTSERL
jgi:hypothetical protein